MSVATLIGSNEEINSAMSLLDNVLNRMDTLIPDLGDHIDEKEQIKKKLVPAYHEMTLHSKIKKIDYNDRLCSNI